MAQDVEVLFNKLKKALPTIMLKHKIPGLSLAIIANHQLQTTLELGVKNTLTRELVDRSTIFEGASFTKPLIGYIALKMCEQNLLKLDTPLRQYLDKPYLNDPKYLKDITLKHVLFHQSGFPEDHLFINEPVELEFKPGTKYLYAQWSFIYLVFTMAKILGDDLVPFIKKEVLIPLDMPTSSLTWQKEYEVLSATGHNQQGMPKEKWHPQSIVGSASLHTTPTEFARFLIHTITQANSLPPHNLLNMLDTRTRADKEIEWGLGWGIENLAHDEMIFHAGNTCTFKSIAMVLRKEGYGIVLMTNSMNSYLAFPEIIQLVFNESHLPIVDFEEFLTSDSKWEYLDEDLRCHWWKNFGL